MNDEVTILVPLHRSAEWLGVVEGNLARLAPHHRVIVSDAMGLDDTLDELSMRWSTHPSVELVGPRAIETGWVPHYNDLLERCRTPWFMWLAHDDEIDADYIDRCRAAARSVPGAVGAFGRIEPIEVPGFESEWSPMCEPGVVVGGLDGALAAIDGWNLGVAFRSVFRVAAPPIARTTGDDEWADLVWIFGRLLSGPLVHVDEAVYRKRFGPGGTHRRWRASAQGPLLAPFLVDELDRAGSAADRRAALTGIAEWAAGHTLRTLEQSDRRVRDQEARGDVLQAALESEHAAVEQLRADVDSLSERIEALYASLTWRVGSGLVGAVQRPLQLLRWLRRSTR